MHGIKGGESEMQLDVPGKVKELVQRGGTMRIKTSVKHKQRKNPFQCDLLYWKQTPHTRSLEILKLTLS